MINIPKAIQQALCILEKDGIKAEIYRMYGANAEYIITLPNVKLEETNERTSDKKIQ